MNVAVIGAGWWGKNIINTFEEIAAIDQVVVFDPKLSIRKKFVANKKTVFVDALDSIVNDPAINAVCIATPPPTHYELANECLNANKHVLVEKPPAYSTHHIEELGLLAEKNRLVYMLDIIYLFLEPIQRIKSMLNSGILDAIQLVQVYRIGDELRREHAGLQRIQNTMFDHKTDVIEDLFFHDAAILIYLFDELRFTGIDKYYLYNTELCDTARIRFETQNFPIELTLSWSFTGRRRGMTIYEKDVIMEYDGLKNENQLFVYRLQTNSGEHFSFSNSPPLRTLLERFIGAIQNENTNLLDATFMKKIMLLWGQIRNL